MYYICPTNILYCNDVEKFITFRFTSKEFPKSTFINLKTTYENSTFITTLYFILLLYVISI